MYLLLFITSMLSAVFTVDGIKSEACTKAIQERSRRFQHIQEIALEFGEESCKRNMVAQIEMDLNNVYRITKSCSECTDPGMDFLCATLTRQVMVIKSLHNLYQSVLCHENSLLKTQLPVYKGMLVHLIGNDTKAYPEITGLPLGRALDAQLLDSVAKDVYELGIVTKRSFMKVGTYRYNSVARVEASMERITNHCKALNMPHDECFQEFVDTSRRVRTMLVFMENKARELYPNHNKTYATNRSKMSSNGILLNSAIGVLIIFNFALKPSTKVPTLMFVVVIIYMKLLTVESSPVSVAKIGAEIEKECLTNIAASNLVNFAVVIVFAVMFIECRKERFIVLMYALAVVLTTTAVFAQPLVDINATETEDISSSNEGLMSTELQRNRDILNRVQVESFRSNQLLSVVEEQRSNMTQISMSHCLLEQPEHSICYNVGYFYTYSIARFTSERGAYISCLNYEQCSRKRLFNLVAESNSETADMLCKCSSSNPTTTITVAGCPLKLRCAKMAPNAHCEITMEGNLFNGFEIIILAEEIFYKAKAGTVESYGKTFKKEVIKMEEFEDAVKLEVFCNSDKKSFSEIRKGSYLPRTYTCKHLITRYLSEKWLQILLIIILLLFVNNTKRIFSWLLLGIYAVWACLKQCFWNILCLSRIICKGCKRMYIFGCYGAHTRCYCKWCGICEGDIDNLVEAQLTGINEDQRRLVISSLRKQYANKCRCLDVVAPIMIRETERTPATKLIVYLTVILLTANVVTADEIKCVGHSTKTNWGCSARSFDADGILFVNIEAKAGATECLAESKLFGPQLNIMVEQAYDEYASILQYTTGKQVINSSVEFDCSSPCPRDTTTSSTDGDFLKCDTCHSGSTVADCIGWKCSLLDSTAIGLVGLVTGGSHVVYSCKATVSDDYYIFKLKYIRTVAKVSMTMLGKVECSLVDNKHMRTKLEAEVDGYKGELDGMLIACKGSDCRKGSVVVAGGLAGDFGLPQKINNKVEGHCNNDVRFNCRMDRGFFDESGIEIIDCYSKKQDFDRLQPIEGFFNDSSKTIFKTHSGNSLNLLVPSHSNSFNRDLTDEGECKVMSASCSGCITCGKPSVCEFDLVCTEKTRGKISCSQMEFMDDNVISETGKVTLHVSLMEDMKSTTCIFKATKKEIKTTISVVTNLSMDMHLSPKEELAGKPTVRTDCVFFCNSDCWGPFCWAVHAWEWAISVGKLAVYIIFAILLIVVLLWTVRAICVVSTVVSGKTHAY